FCDADVTPHPGALRATVSAMEAHDAEAVTAIPRQRPGPWLPGAVVPLVTQFPILALLPLWLVPRVSTSSVAMGNGQWLAFTREAYADSGGHAAVRREVVEDVALARRVKRAGHRLLVVVATRLLEARTYADASSLRDGFGKNLYALTGAHPAGFAAALALFATAAIYP